jgi:hypothetical protein
MVSTSLDPAYNQLLIQLNINEKAKYGKIMSENLNRQQKDIDLKSWFDRKKNVNWIKMRENGYNTFCDVWRKYIQRSMKIKQGMLIVYSADLDEELTRRWNMLDDSLRAVWKLHANVNVTRETIIIQKCFRKYYNRKKVNNLFIKLPIDLRIKIAFYMDEQYHIKCYNEYIQDLADYNIERLLDMVQSSPDSIEDDMAILIQIRKYINKYAKPSIYDYEDRVSACELQIFANYHLYR